MINFILKIVFKLKAIVKKIIEICNFSGCHGEKEPMMHYTFVIQQYIHNRNHLL